jgi:hypothetical protein
MAVGSGMSGRDIFTKSYLHDIYGYPLGVIPEPPIQYLNDLADVAVPDPIDGQTLYFDQAANLWKAK